MRRRRHPLAGSAVPALLLVVGTGCAPALTERPPLSDPAGVARQARVLEGRDVPTFLRFAWSYADARGDVRGEGAARFNPPDSIRLDLFSTGDVSMAVALAGDTLRTRGRIEDVELPGPGFMYAMAGFFRPGSSRPRAGYRLNGEVALRYRSGPGAVRDYYLRHGRLVRLEERRDGELARRVVVTWDGEGTWPRRAEYRDYDTPRRVRWQMEDARVQDEPYPARIYVLPDLAQP